MPCEIRQPADSQVRVRAGLAVVLLLSAGQAEAAGVQAGDADYFEKHVRPVLTTQCIKCHGPEDQSGGLRLDSRAALLRGGEHGPAITPGRPRDSLLIAAIRRQGELAMPPDDPLTAIEVSAIAKWVEQGAAWPASIVLQPPAEGPHWAFQPVRQPPLPATNSHPWVRTPVDAFVLEGMQANEFQPAVQADRRALIRRATFDLLGLPPTAEEVDAFVHNDDPRAWPDLIDRLLDSPHYGEKWGRHWLDVARYSDSKGYVYGREERFWVHASTYRDWVVQALNNDMPYDKFLLLQIAADRVEAPKADLAAMGFLTIGRRFLGVTHDIIDDRIDVVTRGTMGLTVACARCHDHKYDPIPTDDYYSLYGVFRNSIERLVPLSEVPDGESEFARELKKRTQKLHEATAARRKQAADRVRARIQDYLIAQTELHKYPEQGFDQVLEPNDIIPEFVRRWRDYLAAAAAENDPVFAAWRMFAALEPTRFAREAEKVCDQIQRAAPDRIHPAVAKAFVKPPDDMREVAARYANVFREADRQRNHQGRSAETAVTDQILGILYGSDAPCEVPDEPIVNTELFFTTAECTELWKLRGEVDRWLRGSPAAPPHALVLTDRRLSKNARVLIRGNPATPGQEVPRRFPAVLAGPQRTNFEAGSGRLELAQAIIHPDNPLTARVAVNRVWMHHFGAGLVRTPSDFGRRAPRPEHPELLDWLTRRFLADGWSLKKLHRLIMLSATYQQASIGSDPRAQERDPENRLLTRMTPRRLTFEEFRDAALAVAGRLERDVGGRSVDLFGSRRRTIYATVDRQFFPPVMRAFDAANPDLHIAKRSETTVPQQALFVLNHPFAIAQAKAVAAASAAEATTGADRIRRMYRAVLQREPTDAQVRDGLALIQSSDVEATIRPTVTQWTYGFGEFVAESKRVTGFTPLPHFTGKAWQGGPSWPDPQLGWVQVTAGGGHAGNDRQHAAVRRWTAPKAMRIEIRSELRHPVPNGDGVRGFLVSSRSGLLDSADVHNRAQRFDVDNIDVVAGETIDFVVDLREGLNHEEFDWAATVQVVSPVATQDDEASARRNWDSRRDFAGTPTARLDAWAQLAQILLASNEFMFVD